ncbi:UDP-N-acetylmuramoyl-tripeptide--D-alanyl-D-alanine ligase [Carnobacterium iners]|uniref:UDP-N-acetylmuramoyl-tripeptide--D-alanyl-D-alanine ligase n=1 Tax=Carnobacterium iners TaxID=1073423 RepID=A0A1X7MQL0_9LACT|nr:UDP-N-acetylmuramoyl-tripeptide--D-alanyl-D-alanine ligase [Carnobacterium iners]SEL12305.1 UDP-N-acetylmuramoyl-tripeptide--D-alanyl-D-alanine ligase [Carnobacterium iners]SMH27110.1 UDP-N-acetylmuramoyl-tripeptide--D-alanyl-D-alanine ligase [Carnobacterium iners]
MFSLTVKEIAQAVHAHKIEDTWEMIEINNVGFDSRKLSAHSLFVPLVSENDGHSFIAQAIDQGAVATFWSNPLEDAPTDIPVIQVADTLRALQDLAEYYLNKIHPKVIGITGSNGKTTTKDMTEAVVSSQYRVHKTQGNFNNHIGLPITILEMPQDTEVIILEMGMNHAGEIKVLSNLAKPDIAIITMIGESHIEYLGSREGIADAKMEIISGLKETGILIIPGNEPLLIDRANILKHEQVKTFGPLPTNDSYSLEIVSGMKETIFETNLSPGSFIKLPVTGTYNVDNALAALSSAMVLGIPIDKAVQKLATFQLTENRTEWLDGIHGSALLNDAYNANPTAMKAVLTNFSQLKNSGRKIVVLGDMLELGEQTDELHLSIQDALSIDEVDQVILYGTHMKVLYEALKTVFGKERLHHFDGDKDPMIAFLKNLIQPKDYVLLKASFGTDLLSVIRALQVTTAN